MVRREKSQQVGQSKRFVNANALDLLLDICTMLIEEPCFINIMLCLGSMETRGLYHIWER